MQEFVYKSSLEWNLNSKRPITGKWLKLEKFGNLNYSQRISFNTHTQVNSCASGRVGARWVERTCTHMQTLRSDKGTVPEFISQQHQRDTQLPGRLLPEPPNHSARSHNSRWTVVKPTHKSGDPTSRSVNLKHNLETANRAVKTNKPYWRPTAIVQFCYNYMKCCRIKL